MKKTKNSTEKILAELKAQYAEYKELVDTWTTKRDQAIESLNHYSDLAIQTEDAINALEGKPTLKKMLEAAMAQQQAPVPTASGASTAAVGAAAAAAAIPNPNPKNLPPAEPGFKWVVNELHQDVLVPIDTPDVNIIETAVGGIVLPIVTEDSEFDEDDEVVL